MNTNPDLAAMVDYTLRKRPDRGDETAAHISDLYGCDLATWARRRGLEQLPFDARTLVKFELGHAVEEVVSRAIRENYPGDSTRNRRISWNPTTGQCVELRENEAPLDGWMVGHMDIDQDDGTVLEIKSTAFFRGKPPEEPDVHYVEQLRGYLAAWNAERGAVVIVDRISGKILTFWIEPDNEWAKTRAIEVLERTDPSAPFAPEPAPRTTWACKTCRWAACNLNANPQRAAMEELV